MPLYAKLAVVEPSATGPILPKRSRVATKDNVSHVRDENQTGGYALLNLPSSYLWKLVRLEMLASSFFFGASFYSLPLGGADSRAGGMTMGMTSTSWGVQVPGMERSIDTSRHSSFNGAFENPPWYCSHRATGRYRQNIGENSVFGASEW